MIFTQAYSMFDFFIVLSYRQRDFLSFLMCYHKGSRLKDPEHYYFTLFQLYMPWRDERDLQSGWTSFGEKFKHVETEIFPNISNHDCLYGVYDDKDLMNITMVVRTPGKPGIHLEFENFTWKTLKTWNSLVKSWKTPGIWDFSDEFLFC